jgi:hypothetical protein
LKRKKGQAVFTENHMNIDKKEPPTTPPTGTTIYMTNGHPGTHFFWVNLEHDSESHNCFVAFFI